MERRVTRSSSRSSTTPSPPRTTARNWRRTEKLPQGTDSDKENAPPYKNTNEENTSSTTEEICGICLDVVKERGDLNSCTHAFCFECIFQWSKTSNTCPMCKARFVSLRKQGQGKSKRGKQYKVQDVDHRQDDSDFDGWMSSDEDEYMDDWEDLDDGPDDFFMYPDFFYNPFFIDLTEGDDEEDDDVQIDEEEEDDDASEGEKEDGNTESDDDESGTDSDCYIIEHITPIFPHTLIFDELLHVSEGEGNSEVPQTPLLRRSTRLQQTEDSDVEMDDGDSPVVTRGQQQRQAVNFRRSTLRSSVRTSTPRSSTTPQTTRTRSTTRNTTNSPTTTTTRTRTTTMTTTTTNRTNRSTHITTTTTTTTSRDARHARREEARREEERQDDTRKSARLAAPMGQTGPSKCEDN